MKYYVLYNPLAGNGRGETEINNIVLPENSSSEFLKVTEIESFEDFFKGIHEEDKIVVCGGDGTLNRFINSADTDNIKNEILFHASGSGNDFIRDLNLEEDTGLIPINKYIKNLPLVTINGKDYRFINGIGFGIDGYCCVEGDRIRKKQTSNKPINYTPIALKGLLFAFKPTNAKVTIDGKSFNYRRVWLAPTMKGKFFGGGMMIAPNQNRLNPTREVMLLVGHNLSKLKILSIFPLIFKGKHIKHKANVAIHTGHVINVEFDRPTDLQIDGEAFSDILSYSVTTKAYAIN